PRRGRRRRLPRRLPAAAERWPPRRRRRAAHVVARHRHALGAPSRQRAAAPVGPAALRQSGGLRALRARDRDRRRRRRRRRGRRPRGAAHAARDRRPGRAGRRRGPGARRRAAGRRDVTSTAAALPRFLVVGGALAAGNLALLWVLVEALHWPLLPAYTL